VRRASLCVAVLLTLPLLGCEREARRFTSIAPASGRPEPSRPTPLQAGSEGGAAGESKQISMPMKNDRGPYDENAWGVAEGKRLYQWFNCVGCHANGGGGMGPPLMDAHWIYGSTPHDIHESIVAGRPNGMPAFGGRLADQQVWQLVAYVQALGRELRKDVRPGRNDSMSVRPSEQFMKDDREPEAKR
jgi:cytochrome c oxidase cbb3-type subunit III